MRNAELLRSALQSLRANPKRSFLTTIGITIGIAAVITILALGNGVKKRLSDEFNTTQNGEQYTYLYFTPNDSQSAASGFTETDLNAIEERFGAKVKKPQSRMKPTMLPSRRWLAMSGSTTPRFRCLSGQPARFPL